ncbi:hypothetical protein ABTM45_19255, partial [Acinetobacter baumannii]
MNQCVLDYFTLNNASFYGAFQMLNCLPIYRASEETGNNFNFRNCVFYDTTYLLAYNFKYAGKDLV